MNIMKIVIAVGLFPFFGWFNLVRGKVALSLCLLGRLLKFRFIVLDSWIGFWHLVWLEKEWLYGYPRSDGRWVFSFYYFQCMRYDKYYAN